MGGTVAGRLKVRIWNREIKIEGGAVELVRLARVILAGEGEVRLLVIESNDVSPWRANATVPLVIDETTTKVVVSVGPEGLAVRGKADFRKMLADEIERFALGRIAGGSTHIHIDSYPGHFFLADESVPLLIERIEETAS